MPRLFIKRWVRDLQKELQRELQKKVRGSLAVENTRHLRKRNDFFNLELSSPELSIVFVSKDKMKKLNYQHRKKNYATDVLSFGSLLELRSLPELIICPEVIKLQAREHGLPLKMELGYMILHGILHLLGYEHEKSPKKAKEMFDLQDKIFERLQNKF